MEYFYREMRRRYGLLLDAAGEPEGGKWNYDAENRKRLARQLKTCPRPDAAPDDITGAVLALVRQGLSRTTPAISVSSAWP
jgi:deoxyribodipyrimidine photolyase-related protein